jgi:hypothetical protein
MAAASANERDAGFRAVVETVDRQYSASVPLCSVGTLEKTSAPFLNVETEEPIATTSPARSQPSLEGNLKIHVSTFPYQIITDISKLKDF